MYKYKIKNKYRDVIIGGKKMSEEKLDYSKTLNLPKTNFQMRAGLPEKEPKILEEVFEKQHIYEKML